MEEEDQLLHLIDIYVPWLMLHGNGDMECVGQEDRAHGYSQLSQYQYRNL